MSLYVVVVCSRCCCHHKCIPRSVVAVVLATSHGEAPSDDDDNDDHTGRASSSGGGRRRWWPRRISRHTPSAATAVTMMTIAGESGGEATARHLQGEDEATARQRRGDGDAKAIGYGASAGEFDWVRGASAGIVKISQERGRSERGVHQHTIFFGRGKLQRQRHAIWQQRRRSSRHPSGQLSRDGWVCSRQWGRCCHRLRLISLVNVMRQRYWWRRCAWTVAARIHALGWVRGGRG